MKRLLNFSLIAILAVVVLAGCTKNRDHYDDRTEIADVFYFDNGTPYSIIKYRADNTFGIIESIDANTQLWPDFDEVLEGIFIEGRQSRVYNRTGGFYANIFVMENVNTRDEAYDALDYYNEKYGFAAKSDRNIIMNNKQSSVPRTRVNIK